MIRFDGGSVDIARREVRLRGRVQHLEPQAFDVLAYLLEHRDRVVPNHELMDQVWGDQFVSESALTTRVKEVRRALGDDGRAQRLVRNVRSRGYRFVGDLAPPASRRTVGGPGVGGAVGVLEPILHRAGALDPTPDERVDDLLLDRLVDGHEPQQTLERLLAVLR